jgi:hypothetical protein
LADRVVNVRINYLVNTADIQKATAASLQAQKATDNLRKSVEEYQKISNQAYKEIQKDTSKTASTVGSLTSEVGNLYSAIKLVITAGFVRELVDMTLNMAKLSGQVEGVTKAFNRLPNATLLLDNLRTSTHNTVTDLELMQKALTAQNYKIPLQNLGKLLEFAAVKAQQTGQEVNHLVDYIVSGIGLRSIKRLDDLGFTANRVKEALGGVSIQAASMGQLMNAVTTLMDQDLKSTGGFIETAKTDVDELNVSLQKLQLTVAQQTENRGLIKFFKNVVDNVRAGITSTKQLYAESVKAQALKEVNPLTDGKTDIESIQQEINTKVQLIGRNNDEIKQIKERHSEIVKEDSFMKYSDREELDRLKEQFKYYNNRNDVLRTSIKILMQYRDEQSKVNKEVKEGNENAELAVERSLPNQIAFMSPDANLIKRSKTSALLNRNQLVNISKQLEESLKNIPPPKMEISPDITFRPDALQKIGNEFEKNWRDLVTAGIQNTTNLIDSAIQAEADGYDQRLAMLQNYYDNEINMAGDNERRKKELAIERDREERKLRKDAFEADKESKRLQTIVNGAAGIINAFATLPYPAAIVASAFLAGETAAQLAIISQQQYKGYKEGVIDLKGPGTETSDSIVARLSKGESVMTAGETKRARNILTMVRENKLDDRILKGIDFSGGRSVFSDERIVAAIINQKYPKAPDLVKQGRQIYEVYSDRQGNKRYIRSKSI